ncbi:MAG TPA: acylphosphatase [Candidatus Paceibacterota bacterium]|nr:acylphosphatase [Candidatus Paceibacterota bacterium]HMO82534.1 acylphosphatase [Candidatus Paceibacterota bacterium]
MIEIQGTVIGKVQGVQFRDYVQSVAGELGIVGYVQNNHDGSVLVVGQAEPDTLKSFVEYLHEGSVLSEVNSVSVEWGTARVTYDDFSVLQ